MDLEIIIDGDVCQYFGDMCMSIVAEVLFRELYLVAGLWRSILRALKKTDAQSDKLKQLICDRGLFALFSPGSDAHYVPTVD